jgi:hypothetical protein
LWGPAFRHSEDETGDQRLVKNVCMGFSIRGKPVTPAAETHSVLSEQLLNEDEDFGKPVVYATALAPDGEWLKSSGVRETVAGQIEAQATGRSELLADLGFRETYHPNRELVDEFILTAA